ncbi:hypothetical protein C8Q76DRAFT_797815 [Earliella scabrosa]|nr:hypothetical protein C8Q76DRAFT_797815 [Earliella scabrosa]
MARKRGSDAGWAFSLRGRSAFEDDSSSSDSDDDGRNQDEKSELADQDVGNSDHTGSDDSRLLQELDLSSRTDAATYKPNPWSIARANAATRSKPSTQPKRFAPNACKPNPSHPTVLDLLRRQPKKPPHPPSPPTDTRQLNSRSRGQGKQPQQSSMLRPPATTLEDEDDAHIPSDETLVDSGSNDPSYRTKLEDLDSANSTLLAPAIRSLINASNGSSQPHFNSAPHTTSQLMMDSASPAISSASSTSQAVLRNDVPRQQDLRSLLFKPPADVQRRRLSPSSVHAPPQHSPNPHMPAPIPSPSLHTSGKSVYQASLQFTPIPRRPTFKRENHSPGWPQSQRIMHAYYGSPAHPSSQSSPIPVPQRAYSPTGSPPYPGSSPIPDTRVQGRCQEAYFIPIFPYASPISAPTSITIPIPILAPSTSTIGSAHCHEVAAEAGRLRGPELP